MFKEKEDRVLKKALWFLGLAMVAGMVIYMIFLASTVLAAQCESCARDKWCEGETEKYLASETIGHVSADCVLKDEKKAIEFDFGKKYAECAAQAILYADLTDYNPVCVLIRKKTNSDKSWRYYVNRFNIINNHVNPKIELICVNENGGEIKC